MTNSRIKECEEVVFNMPKIEVQRHMLHHKVDPISEFDIFRIAHKDYNVDYLGQTVSSIPKGTLPKCW